MSCAAPKGIPNGFVTFAVIRRHGYKETVKYACNDHYTMDGEVEIRCQNTGNWSAKPVCRGESSGNQTLESTFMYLGLSITSRIVNHNNSCTGWKSQTSGFLKVSFSHPAPCAVGIKRGRIFYNAKKLWIADLKPNRVLHGEHVGFYCLNREERCGYTAVSTCNDGTLPIPECFEGETSTASLDLKRSSSTRWGLEAD